jgi:uncharacterized RDD family membrane protein YckC
MAESLATSSSATAPVPGSRCPVCAADLRLVAPRCPRCGSAMAGSAQASVLDDRTRDRSSLLADPQLLGFGASWTGPRTAPPAPEWVGQGTTPVAGVAPLGSRAAAMLIDVIVLSAVYFVILLGAGALGVFVSRDDLRWLLLLGNVAAGLAAAAYFVGLNAKGQTWGKRALHLAVVDRVTGAPIGLGRATVRYLVFGLMGLPLGLGLLSVALSANLRGWHDQVADDVVVVVPRRA